MRYLGLPFHMSINDHITFINPECHFITDFGSIMTMTNGRRFGQSECGARRRLDCIETRFNITHHSFDFFMA